MLPAHKDAEFDQACAPALALLAQRRACYQSVQAPDPELQTESEAILTAMAKIRGGALWYPYLGTGRGNGALVELIDGSVKLDFIGGIGAHPWGHASELVQAAQLRAAAADTTMQGNLQQNVVGGRVGVQLLAFAQDAGAQLDHCFLSTSGAMANENALKIAFQARAPAKRVFAFAHAFAGRTLALAQVTDKAAYRDGLPATIQVDHIPFIDGAHESESIARSLAAMDAAIHRFPNDHAAFVIEVVQGEGGYNPGTNGFLRAICEKCRQHNILVIIDEVQTFGRLDSAFGFGHFNLGEYVDIATVGKLTQVCATSFRHDIKPRPGLVSQTFTGASASLHVAEVILTALRHDNYFGPAGRNMAIHKRFATGLAQIRADMPDRLAGPWGLGAMIACTPLGGERERVIALAKACFNAGLICFIAGAEPMRLRFLPPLGVVTDGQIDAGLAIFAKCLQEAA